MIRAGVYAVFGPTARAAGAGLLIGPLIAALIAFCNATASAQLAAAYPTSGGTYIYRRERLGQWWGFTAGLGIGKTASCPAMAATVAAYALPGSWWAQRLVAVAVVLGLTTLNYRGVTKTAALTRVLAVVSLVALTAVAAMIAIRLSASAHVAPDGLEYWGGICGILQAARCSSLPSPAAPGSPPWGKMFAIRDACGPRRPLSRVAAFGPRSASPRVPFLR